MRVNSSFHVTCCLDVIAFINVAPNVALQGGGSAVKYVFPSLGLTKVITSYANTNSLFKAWKTEKKICAVITACVVSFDCIHQISGYMYVSENHNCKAFFTMTWSTFTASKRHLVILGGSMGCPGLVWKACFLASSILHFERPGIKANSSLFE